MAKNNIKEKKKILYFDDEPFLSICLVDSLKDDWDVTFVDRVDELFKELNRHKFDILILDIMAPIPEMEYPYVSFTNREIDEMDEGINTGVVLAEKIWTEIDGNYIILFLTARRVDTISQLSRNHKYDYIRKPILISDLNIKLESMIKR